MVTVSHHTRACPGDILGLLISAFPGSHCVVTVTWQLGFLAGEEGRGAGGRKRRCCSQKTRPGSCLYTSGRTPSQGALANRSKFSLDH